MKLKRAKLIPKELAEKEQQLLDRWAEGAETFVKDGLADAEQYCAAPVRILYVLKEVNGGESWDLRRFIRNGGRNETWNVVSRWTQSIFNLAEEPAWKTLAENNEDRRKTYLPCIAAVNMKKTAGRCVADNKKVKQAALQNAHNLREQVALYQPDIIVCCGTGSTFVKAMGWVPDWQMTGRGIWYFTQDQTIVVDYSHPEARTKECLLHYGLTDAVGEIIGETNEP